MTSPPSVSSSSPGQVVILTARAGTWLLGALASDPDLDLDLPVPPMAAHWRPAGPDSALFPIAVTGAVFPSSWAFEEYLGRRLPDAVHQAVATRAAILAAPEAPLPAVGLDGTAPDPSGPVLVPGRPPVSYRRAVATSLPAAGSWTFSGLADPNEEIRIELAGLGAPRRGYRAGMGEDARLAVAYRVSVDGEILAAGADLEIPAATDLTADSTLRGLVAVLLEPEPDAAGDPARAALRARADELASLVVDPPSPYPPGTRVAVSAPASGLGGRPWTGTVVKAYQTRAAMIRSYAVHPDAAELPGHRWHGQPAARATEIIRAVHVGATLRGPDCGLDLADPHRRITYGARVSYRADDDTAITGTVIAVSQDPDRERRYLVQVDGGPQLELPAADCIPRSGTAWPDLATLLAARSADPHPVAAGEILIAGELTVQIVAGADGQLYSEPIDSSHDGAAAQARPADARPSPAARDGPPAAPSRPADAGPAPSAPGAETVTFTDHVHGRLVVDAGRFRELLPRDPDDLRARLTAEAPQVVLTGEERPVILAALAAAHLPGPAEPRAPAAPPPSRPELSGPPAPAGPAFGFVVL